MTEPRADGGALGRSDFSGLESSFDGLDEAFSSWMRDICLGKARLIVPHSYLDSVGKGKGAVFEPEREVVHAGQHPRQG